MTRDQAIEVLERSVPVGVDYSLTRHEAHHRRYGEQSVPEHQRDITWSVRLTYHGEHGHLDATFTDASLEQAVLWAVAHCQAWRQLGPPSIPEPEKAS